MSLTLDQAIQQVPFLAKAQDVKTSPLAGGITNRNYRVDADGKSFVLRIVGEGTDQLGIRRDVEYQANLEAGRLGIAPEVVFYVESAGYLVTRFLEARQVPPEEMRLPENIGRAVRKIRLFHRRGPRLATEFDVFRNIESLTAVANQKGCEFPLDFDWLMQEARATEAALHRTKMVPAPCHNDLLNLNWLWEAVPGDAGELRLLDWEYAGMGDIFFDLANFCSHHAFTEDQASAVLQAYFGDVTGPDVARLHLLWPMSDLREAMWGVAQTGLSELDEDFEGYANRWFGRARERLADPRREQWLKGVSRN